MAAPPVHTPPKTELHPSALSGSGLPQKALPERMLVVLFPNWSIVVHPKARDVAGAVVEGHRIIATSALARADGVHIGQREREAERLSPGVLFFQRDPAGEFHTFAPIIHMLYEMAPNLIVREPGWVAIPTRGPARYFGGERALVAAVNQALVDLMHAQGTLYDWMIGIAEGSFGATLAAREQVIVAAGETATFLADFPIAMVDDPTLADLLERLGIKTLGAFAQFLPEDVLARFGMAGFRAYHRATAQESPPYANYGDDEEIVCERTFDEPITEVETLICVADELSDAFCDLLRERAFRCTICELSVIRSDGVANTRLWQRDYGWDARSITERLRWQLSAWLNEAGESSFGEDAPVIGVSVLFIRAREIVDKQGSQLGFWDRSTDADDEMIRVCVRLEGMLGQNMVMQAQLVGGRGPIERVLHVPFGERVRAQTRERAMPWPGQLPAPSPACIYSERPEITLVDHHGAGVVIDRRGALHGEPAGVILPGGQTRVIEGWAGPWPSDERWWDWRRATRRVRLQLLLRDNSALLVACTRGRWHLEGQYD